MAESESMNIAGFVAEPDWDKFRGAAHGSSEEDWAKARVGTEDVTTKMLANHNPATLSNHPPLCIFSVMTS
jgi:hypothetical protein